MKAAPPSGLAGRYEIQCQIAGWKPFGRAPFLRQGKQDKPALQTLRHRGVCKYKPHAPGQMCPARHCERAGTAMRIGGQAATNSTGQKPRAPMQRG
jgi:hypothetical protein